MPSSGWEADARVPTTYGSVTTLAILQSCTSGSWTISLCSANTVAWCTAQIEKPGVGVVRLGVKSG